MTGPEPGQRARSAEDKAHRREAILAAARGLIAESGFDGVTMAALARRAGLAKGTLYLYVRTKEELFLALFVAAMEAVIEQLDAEAPAEDLPEVLTRIVLDVPLFLPLFARLVAVIEANVDDAALFDAKRAIKALLARLEEQIGRLLSLSPQRAAEVTEVLVLALQGAAQFDLTAQRDPADIPEDLQAHFAQNVFASRFPRVARLILSAAR